MEAMNVLETFDSVASDVKWYALIIVQQDDLTVIYFMFWQSDPPLPCPQYACHHVLWCNEVGAIGPIGCNWRQVVRADFCTTDWFGFDMVHHVAERSIIAMYTICLPSRAVVQWCGCNGSYRSVVYSSVLQLQIRIRIASFCPTQSPIYLKNNPE